MTIDELVGYLETLRRIHGGDQPVIVSGLYGATADEIEVRYERNDKTSAVYLDTNLFTG